MIIVLNYDIVHKQVMNIKTKKEQHNYIALLFLKWSER